MCERRTLGSRPFDEPGLTLLGEVAIAGQRAPFDCFFKKSRFTSSDWRTIEWGS
jgi:hypothetical protein